MREERLSEDMIEKESVEFNENQDKELIDDLTGFYNKTGTEKVVPKLCIKGDGVLMILDIDNFKSINDTYGMEQGDEVIRIFSRILIQRTRNDDILCRIGGDEFLVYFKNDCTERVIAAFSESINMQLELECKQLFGEDFNTPTGVSMGAVNVPADGGKYEEILKLAEKAMKQAKQNGKHGYSLFHNDEDSVFDANTDPDEEFSHMLAILEEKGGVHGTMNIESDAFKWVYRYIARYSETHNSSASLLMFILSKTEKTYSENFQDAVYQFGVMLQKLLDEKDVMTQGRRNTFFLLLPEFSKDALDQLVSNVMEEWKKTEYYTVAKVSYVFSPINEKNA